MEDTSRYEEFMRKFKDEILESDLDEDDYLVAKSVIENDVVDACYYYNIHDMDYDLCVDFVMLYMFKNFFSDDIINNNYIDKVYRAVREFNERRSKLKSSVSNVTTKGKCIDYIKSFLNHYSPIFKSNVNLDELAEKIYDLLKFYGCSESNILTCSCNSRIYQAMDELSFKNKDIYGYSDDFINFYTQMRGYAYKHFKEQEQQIRKEHEVCFRNIDYYNYYNNESLAREDAQVAACKLFTAGYRDISQIDRTLLADSIDNVAYGSMAKQKSVVRNEVKKIDKEARREGSHVKKEELSEEEIRKKKAIILAILAAFVIDNLLYKFSQKSEPSNNKPNSSYSNTSRREAINHNYGRYDSDSNEFIVEANNGFSR